MFRAAVSVKYLTEPSGLYLHIPFCVKRCKYCGFFSAFSSESGLDRYTDSLIAAVKQWGGKYNRPIDTVYLGGGTPSLLAHRLSPLLSAVYDSFEVLPNSEITLEVNPSAVSNDILKIAAESGVNRISVGAQSGSDCELKILGRTHTAEDTVKTVENARRLGFSNISLDVMAGLPFSDIGSLKRSLDFTVSLFPEHISVYLLKIEEKTAFFKTQEMLSLPSDDDQAEQYLFMCDYLRQKGYEHYEISNFCKIGKEGRHNLKYWLGREYLGLGSSAHSFCGGKRFYFPSSLYAVNGVPVYDGSGGDREEYIMLRLRLKSGIDIKEYSENFGEELNAAFLKKCELFEKNGFLKLERGKIALTEKGMLLSNSVIAELSECL